MVYLVFVLYDIYKYIYINVGGKVKYIIRLGEKKKEYLSHTHVMLTCGLIVLTAC